MGIVPQAAVLQDLLDQIRLVGLDEGDDLHGAATVRAQQWSDLVDAFDEHRPPPGAPLVAACRDGGDGRTGRLVVGRSDLVMAPAGLVRTLPPGPQAPGLVGVAAVVADEVLARFRGGRGCAGRVR